MSSRKRAASKSAKARKPIAKKKGRSAKHEFGAGPWFEKLVALQKRLRAPNGCPWDREQTHATLRTYLVEETYETLDALESADDSKFAEEMGDLLLQIVFHSQIAAEEGRFTIADVIRGIHEKMVRRHPHVFGTRRANNSAEVLRNWEKIKAAERRAAEVTGAAAKPPGKSESLLDGVPRHLPATLEAYQLTKKAARIGFDWQNLAGVLEKMREESAELLHAAEANDRKKIEEETGDLLFAAVNAARFAGADPEIALKRANAKFARRFREMERLADEAGPPLAKASREKMEALWEAAKRGERKQLAKEA